MESELDLKWIGGNGMVVLTPEAKKLKEGLFNQGIEKSFIAIDMIKKGADLEEVSKATGLTKIQINQLCTLIL